MNSRLIVFILISFLAVGGVIVYAKNNTVSGTKESQSESLTNFGNPNTATEANQDTAVKTIVSSPTPSPVTMVGAGNKIQGEQTMENVTELKIEDIKVGNGNAVKAGDTAEVNYSGTFLDGRKFDSSYDRNQTFSFSVGAGEVIQGWDQGLIGMKVGGKRKLLIPSDLAYGPTGAGPIPPNTPLAFEIELVSIK